MYRDQKLSVNCALFFPLSTVASGCFLICYCQKTIPEYPSSIICVNFSSHDHLFISIFNSCIFKQNVQFFEFLLNSRPFLEQKQIRNNNNSYNYHKRRGNYCCTLWFFSCSKKQRIWPLNSNKILSSKITEK